MQINLFALGDCYSEDRIQLDDPCPKCQSKEGVKVPGVGPHEAGIRCGNCLNFIKWMPKTKKVDRG